jgi:PAS domain S-box-containing protein
MTGAESLLLMVAEGVEAATGEEFFRSLVRALASALSVQHVFVSQLIDGGTRFQTLALWARGEFAPNVSSPLAGTPCQAVLGGNACFHPARLQALFPEDRILVDWKAESYGGVPMLDTRGRVVGHFAFVHDEPLEDGETALAVMRIFAKRTVAEIERQRAEAALRESRAQLSAILESATDAVIAVDSTATIRFTNPSAGRMLRTDSAGAVGSSLWRFTTDSGRAALESSIAELERNPRRRLFAGEQAGLQGRRADGDVFPFEGTVSRSELGGSPLYTLILRDLEERREEERELEHLRGQTEYLRQELASVHPFEEIVGRSPTLLKVLEEADRAAGTDATVLVWGETGTGKELVARALHARSRRSAEPLVKVNCAAIPGGLVESELFGHERGAFTGANERRIGRFELAHKGTLFLDEIGDLPLDAQAKLLRVLQEREFERVGGTKSLQVDVRVIAATNRDLNRLVSEGRFREDLYYRLHVVPIRLPPLRERPDDLPLLAGFFVSRMAPGIGRAAARVSEASLGRMRAYDWPGNVRELQNVIERALILTPPDARELQVPAGLLASAGAERAQATPARGPAPRPADALSLEEVERSHIVAALNATGGRIEGPGGAARHLGLHPSTLRSRLKKLGIRRAQC